MRGRAAGSPALTRLQPGALEFHCGNPPPAAAPRTIMSIMDAECKRKTPPVRDRRRYSLLLFATDVAVDFGAQGDFNNLGGVPGHGILHWLRWWKAGAFPLVYLTPVQPGFQVVSPAWMRHKIHVSVYPIAPCNGCVAGMCQNPWSWAHGTAIRVPARTDRSGTGSALAVQAMPAIRQDLIDAARDRAFPPIV